MPTGYTADIEKGISFEQYALSCARAFGALIDMRDDPKDAKIPEKFKPSTYYRDVLKKEKKQLKEIESLSEETADARAREDYQELIQHHTEAIQRARNLEAKYRDMLESVEAFTPPTPEHVRLKEFMKEQIVRSLDFDCNIEYHQNQIDKAELLPGKTWIQVQKETLRQAIERHTEAYQAEVERTESRNAWVRELRKSLSQLARPNKEIA